MGRLITNGSSGITMGSDASVDAFNPKSGFLYTNASPSAGAAGFQFTKTTGWTFVHTRAVALETAGHLTLQTDWSTIDGTWVTANNTVPSNSDVQVGYTYNNASTANDPVLYINGASSAISETSVPTGSAVSDAAATLDFLASTTDTVIGFLVYDDVAFTAADANRHRWWGCAPGGPSTVSVWHPMWTTESANKGTAIADMTVGDSTPAAISRVERMWAGTMGCGR